MVPNTIIAKDASYNHINSLHLETSMIPPYEAQNQKVLFFRIFKIKCFHLDIFKLNVFIIF
jgi:hypothetical protein